jgi:hypothetical protein
MPDLDPDRPQVAAAMLLAAAALLVLSIAMDSRRLPFGRVKYVPWTHLTLAALLAACLAGRHLLLVVAS